MTVASVCAHRLALWRALLCDDFGYAEAVPSRPARSANELVVIAVRPELEPVEPVRFEIHETWLPGDDPDGLSLEAHGCYLAVSSWHAQIVAAAGAEGAERLDVDRRKPADRVIHRHPLGHPNHDREPAAPLAHPDAWVIHVERLIATHYGY